MRLLRALSTLAYTVAGALSDELLFEDHASVADVASEAADDVLDAADDSDASLAIDAPHLQPLPAVSEKDLAEDHPPMPDDDDESAPLPAADGKDSFVAVRPSTRPPSWKAGHLKTRVEKRTGQHDYHAAQVKHQGTLSMRMRYYRKTLDTILGRMRKLNARQTKSIEDRNLTLQKYTGQQQALRRKENEIFGQQVHWELKQKARLAKLRDGLQKKREILEKKRAKLDKLELRHVLSPGEKRRLHKGRHELMKQRRKLRMARAEIAEAREHLDMQISKMYSTATKWANRHRKLAKATFDEDVERYAQFDKHAEQYNSAMTRLFFRVRNKLSKLESESVAFRAKALQRVGTHTMKAEQYRSKLRAMRARLVRQRKRIHKYRAKINRTARRPGHKTHYWKLRLRQMRTKLAGYRKALTKRRGYLAKMRKALDKSDGLHILTKNRLRRFAAARARLTRTRIARTKTPNLNSIKRKRKGLSALAKAKLEHERDTLELDRIQLSFDRKHLALRRRHAIARGLRKFEHNQQVTAEHFIEKLHDQDHAVKYAHYQIMRRYGALRNAIQDADDDVSAEAYRREEDMRDLMNLQAWRNAKVNALLTSRNKLSAKRATLTNERKQLRREREDPIMGRNRDVRKRLAMDRERLAKRRAALWKKRSELRKQGLEILNKIKNIKSMARWHYDLMHKHKALAASIKAIKAKLAARDKALHRREIGLKTICIAPQTAEEKKKCKDRKEKLLRAKLALKRKKYNAKLQRELLAQRKMKIKDEQQKLQEQRRELRRKLRVVQDKHKKAEEEMLKDRMRENAKVLRRERDDLRRERDGEFAPKGQPMPTGYGYQLGSYPHGHPYVGFAHHPTYGPFGPTPKTTAVFGYPQFFHMPLDHPITHMLSLAGPTATPDQVGFVTDAQKAWQKAHRPAPYGPGMKAWLANRENEQPAPSFRL